MSDFTLRIPRVSVAISEATLIDQLVEEGGHVSLDGQVLGRR